VTLGYSARAALVAAVMASACAGSRSNFEVEDDLMVMYQGSVDDCAVHSTMQLIRVAGNWASHSLSLVASSKGHVATVRAVDPLPGSTLMTTNVIGVILGALVGEAEAAEGVADGLADSVGVADGLADVGVADGLADSVGVADGLADSVGVADGFFVASTVGVAVGAPETGESETGVTVGENVLPVAVGVFESVGAPEMAVGVPVGAADSVGILVGDDDVAVGVEVGAVVGVEVGELVVLVTMTAAASTVSPVVEVTVSAAFCASAVLALGGTSVLATRKFFLFTVLTASFKVPPASRRLTNGTKSASQ